MKKTLNFILLILFLVSIVYGESLFISINIPDRQKITENAANYLSLGVKNITTKTISFALSEDGPWLDTEIIDSRARIKISSINQIAKGVMTFYIAEANSIESLDISLVLCGLEDEAYCYFIEKQFIITDEHREDGKITIFLSPGKY
jgi:hypothetical protein